ncbi:MAG: SET domain-containing protein [Gemmataceae bacterium]|nr:SET domain-containing protein [Gemmataceae bacterium]
MEIPLEVGTSPTLGIRGLIATRDIRKGEVIERCPVVFIDNRHTEALKQTAINNFWYEWNKQYRCIVLGYGSLYNHSYKPNAKYHYDYRNRRLVYTTLRDIRKGEELFINYNGVPNDRSKVDDIYVDGATHG